MSKYKVYLSPSSQTDNAYAAGNTNESYQCGKIATACKKALERNGVDVKIGHNITLVNKCYESNAYGADLHVPIHTNAANKKVSGTRIFCYKLSGDGYKACKSVYNVLAPLTPGTSENIKTADFYEIMHSNAPAVYIECEFHDVPSVAKWIIAHTTDIGEAIAKGICNYFGIKFKSAGTTSKPATNETFKVKVIVSALNVRKGPGIKYEKNSVIKDKGTYTIVKEENGWGKLKSGAGWINISSKYVKKL